MTALHDGHRRVVAAADAAAAALRVRPGAALAHAVATVPGLLVLEADAEGDAAALRRLAGWCCRVTPLAAPDGADGLWLDVTGCAPLWGGEAALMALLVRRMAQDGVQARAAVADTPGAAHAMARYGTAPVVSPGAQAEAVAPLPVAALRLDGDMVATLRRLGLEQVGHVARLPRAALARRFGPLPGLRLDQAQGRVFEPIKPLPPALALQHRLAFLEPLLTAEALGVAIDRLAAVVCGQMEREGSGARRVDLVFERVDGAAQFIRIGTARPNRDAGHLARLLREHLEQVDPGLGIEAMRLGVPLAEALCWRQGDTEGATDVSALVDRLANRLGAERVYRAAPVDSDLPERSVRRVPALARAGGRTWPGLMPPPTRLLHPPRPVQAVAELPDQPPRIFVWQRQRHRVCRADGPERIYGEWWQRDGETQAVRDYFRVEDEDGRRFWLFRQGDGADGATGDMRWFVHGIY